MGGGRVAFGGRNGKKREAGGNNPFKSQGPGIRLYAFSTERTELKEHPFGNQRSWTPDRGTKKLCLAFGVKEEEEDGVGGRC